MSIEKSSQPGNNPDKKLHNPDILPVPPQIQTRYINNLEAISAYWSNRFRTETTLAMPDGKGYYSIENGKRALNLNSDFWTGIADDVLRQKEKSMLAQGVPQSKVDEMKGIINLSISSDSSLTRYGKYIRIESLVLAYEKHYARMAR